MTHPSIRLHLGSVDRQLGRAGEVQHAGVGPQRPTAAGEVVWILGDADTVSVGHAVSALNGHCQSVWSEDSM